MQVNDGGGSGPHRDDLIARQIAEIRPADLDLHDPPEGLWGRIAAAVGTDLRRADLPPCDVGMVVEYVIDRDDIVTPVGDGWTDFATANDGGPLTEADQPRTLWSAFGSDEIRDLWRLIVERVRADDRQVTVPLRCDASHARRWFEMTVTPESEGAVRFRSVLVREESRSAVPLLDAAARRDLDAAPVELCSWCGHGRAGDSWMEVGRLVREQRLLEAAALPPISYGICPTCRDTMSSELLAAPRRSDGV